MFVLRELIEDTAYQSAQLILDFALKLYRLILKYSLTTTILAWDFLMEVMRSKWSTKIRWYDKLENTKGILNVLRYTVIYIILYRIILQIR